MTSYAPQPAEPGGGLPPCANCGAAFRLHAAPAADVVGHTATVAGRLYVTARGMWAMYERGGSLACPTQARVGSLESAIDALVAAQRGGDQTRMFAARGDVQRLMGHRPEKPTHCAACLALGLAEV